MRFFIASKNKHKIGEFKRILEPLGFDVVCENDLQLIIDEVEETGKTFLENALIKARACCKATSLPAIADDSGLCVDFLDGAPGVYSARFAGEPVNNEKNNEKLLTLLKNVPQKDRTARFECCIACVFPDGRELTVSGVCNGYIAEDYSGKNGFGYDPLFVSSIGCFGDLSDDQKDSVSHRGNALRKFAEEIKKYI